MTIIDYYKEHLTHVFDEEKTSRIITNSQIYTNNLHDDRSSDESTDFDTTMKDLVLPLIGLYRAMLLEGFTEQEVGSYLKALWDIAPEELKNARITGSITEVIRKVFTLVAFLEQFDHFKRIRQVITSVVAGLVVQTVQNTASCCTVIGGLSGKYDQNLILHRKSENSCLRRL